jgi:nicotinamidase-related amidase
MINICLVLIAANATAEPMQVHLRSRLETAPKSGQYQPITRAAEWNGNQTALVVCDMWDDHTCPSAANRVAQMAPRMNDVLKAARAKGVLIIHCPSGTMKFYENHPGRRLSQSAPPVETARTLERWCYLDKNREPPLPIDDSDPCDCERTWKKGDPYPWTRQIATLEIMDGDAITDSAEAYYLMRQRGIQNVIVMGVHTNMCVLGRPFGIRQLVYQGLNVALMRDMTDAMYNPAQRPFVSHFEGTDLIVEHIEKHWCPTLTSVDFLGGTAFRFPGDERPRDDASNRQITGSGPTLVQESFEDANLKARGWYDIASTRIADGGIAGTRCLEFEWQAGDSQPRGTLILRRLFAPTNEVFVRYYLKLSKNWDWTGRNYHPHLTQFMTTENRPYDAPATTHLTLYVEPVAGKLRLATSDMQNKDAPHGLTQGPLRGHFNGRLYDSDDALFSDDKWHCIEAQFKLNSLDTANDRPHPDGIARAWFDGQLVVEHTDVVFRSTDLSNMKINQLLLAPYFGPGLLPHSQKLWIDELAISTDRISPLPLQK